jgi:hypothetical protein
MDCYIDGNYYTFKFDIDNKCYLKYFAGGIIKTFDYHLDITPQNIKEKIKTILNFI